MKPFEAAASENPGTLFVVRRGVCMHGGRVLVAGSLWGQDALTRRVAQGIPSDTFLFQKISNVSILIRFVLDPACLLEISYLPNLCESNSTCYGSRFFRGQIYIIVHAFGAGYDQ